MKLSEPPVQESTQQTERIGNFRMPPATQKRRFPILVPLTLCACLAGGGVGYLMTRSPEAVPTAASDAESTSVPESLYYSGLSNAPARLAGFTVASFQWRLIREDSNSLSKAEENRLELQLLLRPDSPLTPEQWAEGPVQFTLLNGGIRLLDPLSGEILTPQAQELQRPQRWYGGARPKGERVRLYAESPDNLGPIGPIGDTSVALVYRFTLPDDLSLFRLKESREELPVATLTSLSQEELDALPQLEQVLLNIEASHPTWSAPESLRLDLSKPPLNQPKKARLRGSSL